MSKNQSARILVEHRYQNGRVFRTQSASSMIQRENWPDTGQRVIGFAVFPIGTQVRKSELFPEFKEQVEKEIEFGFWIDEVVEKLEAQYNE